jgi:predicted RNase H-like nuclease (RuvC/YqgF family)
MVLNLSEAEKIRVKIANLEEEIKDLQFEINDKLYSIKELEVQLEKLRK